MIVQMHFTHAMHVCRNMNSADYNELSAISLLGEANDFCDAMAVQSNQLDGCKYALLKDEEPICIGGLAPISAGVLNVWGIGTDRVAEVATEYTLFARRMIRWGMHLPHVNRIQAVTAATHNQAHRWLQLAGLSQESVLRRFGRNGENYFMYAVTDNV